MSVSLPSCRQIRAACSRLAGWLEPTRRLSTESTSFAGASRSRALPARPGGSNSSSKISVEGTSAQPSAPQSVVAMDLSNVRPAEQWLGVAAEHSWGTAILIMFVAIWALSLPDILKALAEALLATDSPAGQSSRNDQRRFVEQQEHSHTGRQQNRGKRRTGRSGATPKPVAFIVHTDSGRVYCVGLCDGVVCVQLPGDLTLTEGEWSGLVAAAAQSELWRRTQDVKHFTAAVQECVDKKVAKMAAGPPSHLLAQYVAARAVSPKLEELSAPELRNIIRQNSYTWSPQAHKSTDRSLILPLAGRALQVWECNRILKCSRLPASSTEQEVAAALCVLQLEFGTAAGAAVSAARGVNVSELRRRYQQLARRVHPDKMHRDHTGGREQFEESFKQLVKAYELLSSYACQG